MASAGLATALIQLHWGATIRQHFRTVKSQEIPDLIVIANSCSERVTLVELPYVLLLFWGAIWLWLLFARQ